LLALDKAYTLQTLGMTAFSLQKGFLIASLQKDNNYAL
jgi:hypothetical protein